MTLPQTDLRGTKLIQTQYLCPLSVTMEIASSYALQLSMTLPQTDLRDMKLIQTQYLCSLSVTMEIAENMSQAFHCGDSSCLQTGICR